MTTTPAERAPVLVYEDSPPADVALADRVSADKSTRQPVLIFFSGIGAGVKEAIERICFQPASD